MITENVAASDLNHGDTILIDGKMHTFSRDDRTNPDGFGVMVKGQRFPGGVERVLFPKFYRGILVGHFPQI